MADRFSQYVIGFGGDDADLRTLFTGMKSRLRSDVAELKSITEKVELFSGISDNLPKVQAALDKAKAQAKSFADEIDKLKGAGKRPTQDLVDGFAQAERAAKTASAEFARQQQQLATLGSQLTRAGVDTKNLAAEQQRLAVASKAASDAAAVLAAKQQLGLVTVKDTTAEAAKLRAAFDTLKASGTLSASETAAAQKLLQAELKALQGTINASGQSFVGFARDAKSSFSDVALKATAVTAAFAGVGAAVAGAIDAAKQFNNALATIGTVTTLPKSQLAALGGQVRQLSQEIGINAVEATKSLFEIIRSGVPADNSFEVLRAGALAAKAALTDTATGAKAASVLIDSFGLNVKDLSGALDIVVNSAQHGGPTLKEFAENAGGLGNAARAAGADFKEVSALLNVMTDASNDAAGSTALLAKILINLNKPEVKDALHRLGLDGLSLVETFRRLDAKGLNVNDFLSLGIAGGKAAVALTSLLNNVDKIPEAMQRTATAAGTVTQSVEKLADTAEERSKRLDAAIDESKRSIGEIIGAQSELADVAARVLKFLNDDFEATKQATKASDDFAKSNRAAIAELLSLSELADPTTASLAKMTTAAEDSAQGFEEFQKAAAAVAKEIAAANSSLEVSSRSLTALTAAVQKSAQDQIAAIRERSQVEIDLLDKSTAKQVETAAKTLEIQAQANADILKVTQDGQKLVNDAVDAAIRARTALERKKIAEGKGDEEQYNKDVSAIRLNALTVDLANARKFQDELIAQRNATQQRLNAIDQSRVDFNRSINDAIKAIALEGQTSLQQFAEKQKEVDRLIAEARQVAATQGITAAQQYFEKAKTLSESLRGQVTSDGTIVVSEFESTQTAVKNLRKVQDAYNDESAKARASEQRGFDESSAKLKTVGANIDEIQGKVTALRKESSEAIVLSVSSDIRGIDAAAKKLDELTRDRAVTVTVNYQTPSGTPAPAPGFARGGPVWRQFAQAYASGGPVFRRPGWSKVPGSGRGDTVPAILQAGSFVMRRAAVDKYGDGVMAKLARGYAAGGFVSDLIFGNTPGKKKTEFEKISEYVNSLPKADQQQFRADMEVGGTAALIAQNEALDAIATQERGPAKAIAPKDVSPLPSPQDAIGYGRYVESLLRFGNVFDLVKRGIGEYIKQIEVNPTPFLIQSLIRTARAAASNAYLQDFHTGTGFGAQIPGKSPQLLDWYDFIAQAGQSGRPGRARRFADGGDVVPAMLTPGEWIIPKHVAAMLGGGFLHAMNNLQLAPPAMPRYFAAGGAVPGASIPEHGTAGVGGITVNVYGAPSDFKDPVAVRRLLMPTIREIDRRTGRK